MLAVTSCPAGSLNCLGKFGSTCQCVSGFTQTVGGPRPGMFELKKAKGLGVGGWGGSSHRRQKGVLNKNKRTKTPLHF